MVEMEMAQDHSVYAVYRPCNLRQTAQNAAAHIYDYICFAAVRA